MRTSGRRVQNRTRKPEVADDIMYSARVQVHVILRMSTQCVREGVHCGVTMETLLDQVPVLPVENYTNPIPEENVTRLSPAKNEPKHLNKNRPRVMRRTKLSFFSGRF